MYTTTDIQALRKRLRDWRQHGDRIVLVPTMGNLHAGHLSLVAHARALGERVVATIFVNPMQFDRADDLVAYPRTFEPDCEKLESAGTDLLFVPEVDAIFPQKLHSATQVVVPDISKRLEGASRAGHFTGVATIVCKLFNIIQPDSGVFGEKDYQQLQVIRKMVDDLNIPISIEAVVTVREQDGLAMSSRNGYLTEEERKIAPDLYATLLYAADRLQENAAKFREIEVKCCEMLEKHGFSPDYFEICRPHDLMPATHADSACVILAAAWLGKARLIDNLQLNLKPGV